MIKNLIIITKISILAFSSQFNIFILQFLIFNQISRIFGWFRKENRINILIYLLKLRIIFILWSWTNNIFFYNSLNRFNLARFKTTITFFIIIWFYILFVKIFMRTVLRIIFIFFCYTFWMLYLFIWLLIQHWIFFSNYLICLCKFWNTCKLFVTILKFLLLILVVIVKWSFN
jgi:hypothetical protein